jgi:hypothetical protein
VELGLYGKRIEARTLKEMIEVLQRLEGVVPPDVVSQIRKNGNGISDDLSKEGDDNDHTNMELDEGDGPTS